MPVYLCLPHQPQWPGLKAVTAGSKARWFQQLVNAIGQATFKGQVPLHNSGIIFTHHELTLQAEGVGYMGVTDTQQPSSQYQGPCLLPSLQPSPQTHRPSPAAGEGNGGPVQGAKWAQVGQVRRHGLRRRGNDWSWQAGWGAVSGDQGRGCTHLYVTDHMAPENGCQLVTVVLVVQPGLAVGRQGSQGRVCGPQHCKGPMGRISK